MEMLLPFTHDHYSALCQALREEYLYFLHNRHKCSVQYDVTMHCRMSNLTMPAPRH